MAARIGKEAGLCVPTVELCVANNELGIISLKFHGDDEVLTHGSELMQGLQPDYDPHNHAIHTIDLALAALDEVSCDTLRVEFIRMLAFDAWIGNGDRHQENWGVISAGGQISRLAPAYDMAACLGSGLVDATVRQTLDSNAKLEKFVHECPSGFGDGLQVVKMPKLAAQLRSLDEWRTGAAAWLDDFRRAERFAQRYMEGIPRALLSHDRKRFASEMLSRRLKWFERYVP